MDKVKAKLISDLTKAGTVSSAYEYDNTFLLDASNLYVPVTTTPAAWADKVKEVGQRVGFKETPVAAAAEVPAEPPALALEPPKPALADAPAAPIPIPAPVNEKDLEAYAKAGAVASQTSWFWRMFGY